MPDKGEFLLVVFVWKVVFAEVVFVHRFHCIVFIQWDIWTQRKRGNIGSCEQDEHGTSTGCYVKDECVCILVCVCLRHIELMYKYCVCGNSFSNRIAMDILLQPHPLSLFSCMCIPLMFSRARLASWFSIHAWSFPLQYHFSHYTSSMKFGLM